MLKDQKLTSEQIQEVQITFEQIYAINFNIKDPDELLKLKKRLTLFLATFDLVNLEKLTKTAPSIRLGKNPTKDLIIAKIIDYDLKHKYFLCKQLYYNGATYSKNASYEGIKEQIADLQREN